ncbi:tubulin-specific chaperone C [Xylariaceae sp. FL0594]|nr:tubulin-specific chaperone C [Xylariaceae sp. FL0594]
MADPKEKFFRHFQAEIILIQDEINSLATLSPIGGERKIGIEHVLTGISRLSKEVLDAADYIPSYDQRTYSQAIKALTDKLNETTGKLAPKARFQFKPRNTEAESTTKKPQSTLDPRVHRPWGNDGSEDMEDSGVATPELESRDAVGDLPVFSSSPPSKNYNEELSRPDAHATGGVRKPSFSTAKNIAISKQKGLHIILPSSAARATSSGSLTDLDRCVVDMTIPTSTGAPFAGLALKNIRRSLIIAGHVAGPAHITGIVDSVIVVAARQVRMHDCKNVHVYLHCSSHPIIEDCEAIKFAPLPEYYVDASSPAETNQWDQVDDFKWLKDTASPNWSIMPEDQRVAQDVWKDTVCGSASLSTDNILRKVGVPL